MYSVLQNATITTSTSAGTLGLWTNLLAVMLASMIALRLSKGRKPFDWNDLFEDLLYGGLGTAFSYGVVYVIVVNS